MNTLFFKKGIQKGFTIIETLVAITILMISIAGPLTIASKGLTAALVSRDQMTASYLAQDVMEYVKNIRDNNIVAGNAWLTGLSDCVNGKNCDFDTVNGNALSPVYINCPVQACSLYLADIGGYFTPDPTLSPSNNATKFSQAFTITPLNMPPSSTDPEDAPSALVTVTVSWSNTASSDQIIIKSFIFNTLR